MAATQESISGVTSRRMTLPDGRRKYAIRERAFANRTRQSDYFAGLMFADGNVASSGNWCSIELQSRDISILKHLRDFVVPGRTVKRTRRRTKHGKGEYAKLVMHSRLLCEDLARYGVIPAKSKIASVPREMRSSIEFWRGVVDGDGTIIMSRDDPAVILYGTEAVCRQFATFTQRSLRCKALPVVEATRIRRVAVYGWHKAITLIRILYGDAPEKLRLERKYKYAMRIVKLYEKRCANEARLAEEFRRAYDAAVSRVCIRHLASDLGMSPATVGAWRSRMPSPRIREKFVRCSTRPKARARCYGCRIRLMPAWRQMTEKLKAKTAKRRAKRQYAQPIRGRTTA